MYMKKKMIMTLIYFFDRASLRKTLVPSLFLQLPYETEAPSQLFCHPQPFGRRLILPERGKKNKRCS